MAIATYAQLQATVTEYLARSDLSSLIPDFIAMAHSDINARLRVRQMETIATLTPVDGVVSLPADYLEYRRVVDTGSPRRDLRYIAPTLADQTYPDRQAGRAADFTIVGDSLYTFPLAGSDIELTYFAAVPALSDSNTTNWLLTKRPELYLRLTLAQGFQFIRNAEKAAENLQIAEMVFASMDREDTTANYARASVRLGRVTP